MPTFFVGFSSGLYMRSLARDRSPVDWHSCRSEAPAGQTSGALSSYAEGIRERLFIEIDKIVRYEGMELVDLEYKPEKGGWVLRLYIDRDGGVSLGDCEEISKQVGMMLDVEDIIPHSYTLEVSSPGLDRRLRRREDFVRFAGKLVRIKLRPDHTGRKKYRGRLAGLDGDDVLLDDPFEGCSHRIPLDDIASARLEIEL